MTTSTPDTILKWPHLYMLRVGKGSFLREGHEVNLSAFELAAFPVTQALWEAVMAEGSNSSRFEGPRRPVERVSWYDAVAFCNRLNHLEKLPFCYFSNEICTQPYALEGELLNEGPVYYKPAPGVFRLPTQAEWEYAARGGSCQTETEYAGSDRVKDVGWYGDNSGRQTHPVGLLQPNTLGLYDMSGNVDEWCWDWKGDYSPEAQTDPVGPPEGQFRVVRGGAWSSDIVRYLRVSYRDDLDFPGVRSNYLGFRLARHLTL